jgi:formylglycine-generating enzyme required for sulfatase activity
MAAPVMVPGLAGLNTRSFMKRTRIPWKELWQWLPAGSISSPGRARNRLACAAVLVVVGCSDEELQPQAPPECVPFAGPTMVTVAAGEYEVGNTDYMREQMTGWRLTVGMMPPIRSVSLPYSFAIQNTEVTRGAYMALMGYDPTPEKAFIDLLADPDWDDYRNPPTPESPVQRVSWYESLAYANALSESEGLEPCYDLAACTGVPSERTFMCTGTPQWRVDCDGYRLPTAIEWEIAARAGTDWDFVWGPAARADRRQAYALASNAVLPHFLSGSSPLPVGSLCPNAWGLHDVQGNVSEWVIDGAYPASPDAVRETSYTFRVPRNGEVAFWAPGNGNFRESRGGSLLSRDGNPGLGVRRPVRAWESGDWDLIDYYHQGLRLVRFREWASDEPTAGNLER